MVRHDFNCRPNVACIGLRRVQRAAVIVKQRDMRTLRSEHVAFVTHSRVSPKQHERLHGLSCVDFATVLSRNVGKKDVALVGWGFVSRGRRSITSLHVRPSMACVACLGASPL